MLTEEKKIDNAVKEEIAPYISKMTHIAEDDVNISDAVKDQSVGKLRVFSPNMLSYVSLTFIVELHLEMYVIRHGVDAMNHRRRIFRNASPCQSHIAKSRLRMT